MKKTTKIPEPSALNLAFVEKLFEEFRDNPESVSDEWRRWFERQTNGDRDRSWLARPSFQPADEALPHTLDLPFTGNGDVAEPFDEGHLSSLQDRLNQLIRNYRVQGHRIASIDPLGRTRECPPELEPAHYQFTRQELEKRISSETFQGDGPHTVSEILANLKNTYTRSIGVQFMHINDLSIRRWLQRRMEGTENRIELSRSQQIRILTKLTDAATFEEFIRKKYIGAKSFSLEGSESLLPLLDLAIEKGGEQGVTGMVLGMAHRGRLNVLSNILGKRPRDIFREFEDTDPELYYGRGDVKYHLGYSSDYVTEAGHRVHLSLCFNPSHLEFVNPVVLGRVRAKQDRARDLERRRCMAVIIHGDDAFPGEGIVQETLNLSQLPGYFVGGALHVIVNNQIGFTTPPEEYRSVEYSTDVAKMLQSPIFHVNGEDPEAVAQVVNLAMDFRAEFQRDVLIDMYAYRRLGHNEGDEPAFTQPLLYRAIEKRKSVREGYLEHLLKLNGLSRAEADEIAERRRELLESDLSEARREDYRASANRLRGPWDGYRGGSESKIKEIRTGVARKKLASLLDGTTRIPAGFNPHPKIEKFLEGRRAMAAGERPLDWASAEALAFATLATQGHRIRLTGQDSARGTFSQRHAVLHDFETGESYTPLQHLEEGQAPVEIVNSPLSEGGVLGFDYGYSLDHPEGLIAWEAQFGDFINAAQVIIDQFISSAEDKWRRLSGIVLLLPHGFEGQGPEHSSARLERFLNMAAEDNIQVVCPTTPGQYFHCLRRQVLSRWRKPLVVMAPKKLLRHAEAVSDLDECASGQFQRVIPDPLKPGRIRRVLLCTGKVYYDLAAKREELQRDDVAIVRVEQLYPLREKDLKSGLAKYRDETQVFWVQEEPENMGAWRFLRVLFGDHLFDRFPFSGLYRPASASPATGSASSHNHEQNQLLIEAFGGA